nr:hypothetical protein [Vibrio sp. SCSIO 43136]
MEVVEAEKSDLDSFFVYLENQLSENGNGEVPLFQPMSREQGAIPEATKDKFIQGFSHQFGDLGWRKLWVVKDTSGNIKGHIDLRHHSDESRSHRVPAFFKVVVIIRSLIKRLFSLGSDEPL